MLSTSLQKVNHEKEIGEVLDEVIQKLENDELHPVLTSNKYYNAIIEHLEDFYIRLKDDFTPDSNGYKYEQIMEIDKEEVINNILREYGQYFNL